MSKYIDIKNCTFEFSPADVGGAVVSISKASTKVKATGTEVLTANTTFSVSAYSNGSPIDVPLSGASTADFSFTASAQKVKAEGSLVLLEGDKANIMIKGKKTTPSGTTEAIIPVIITIKVAGQEKVKGA